MVPNGPKQGKWSMAQFVWYLVALQQSKRECSIRSTACAMVSEDAQQASVHQRHLGTQYCPKPISRWCGTNRQNGPPKTVWCKTLMSSKGLNGQGLCDQALYTHVRKVEPPRRSVSRPTGSDVKTCGDTKTDTICPASSQLQAEHRGFVQIGLQPSIQDCKLHLAHARLQK